jgi:hypothetical protein
MHGILQVSGGFPEAKGQRRKGKDEVAPKSAA